MGHVADSISRLIRRAFGRAEQLVRDAATQVLDEFARAA